MVWIKICVLFFLGTCSFGCGAQRSVERALQVELPVTDGVDVPAVHEYLSRVYDTVLACRYDQALDATLEGLIKFPANFALQLELTILLGDHSENFSSPLKEIMIQRSKELFIKLGKEVYKQPKRDIYLFRNEYYYRFAMYKDQYELGIEVVADYWGTPEWQKVGKSGYYYQGVGAANYARELCKQGDKELATCYAHKALVAWAQYFTLKNDYYNAYVHYALALGILGHTQEMMRALQRSADLIKRDLTYHEFKEVIEFVEQL